LFTAFEGNISNFLGCALTVTSSSCCPVYFKTQKTQPSETDDIPGGHYAPGRDFAHKSHA